MCQGCKGLFGCQVHMCTRGKEAALQQPIMRRPGGPSGRMLGPAPQLSFAKNAFVDTLSRKISEVQEPVR